MQAPPARFASTPIGPLLAARDGGLRITVAGAADINRAARSDVSHTTGTHGVEFAFWGDDPLVAEVGLIATDAPLNASVGGTSGGVGWRLAQGEIRQAGAVLVSGLPPIGKGESVGVRIVFGSPQHTVEFYRGKDLVHSRAVTLAGAIHFAASIAASDAGKLWCAANAGQWQPRSAAAKAGWASALPSTNTAKLADVDYLSAATDLPPHARYEGLILDGLTTVAQIGFWAWGDAPPLRGGGASCRVQDPDGLLDATALQDLQGTPVAIRLGSRSGDVDSAVPVARYVIDRIEIQGDSSKQVIMDDAHRDLDQALSRGVFLPNIPALQWTPLPVVIGAVASVPALPCNSDGTALFLADRELASIDVVMDRGDIMEPGTYTVSPDGQQIRMASPSIGPVVADVSTIAAGPQPATLLQFLHDVFGRRGKMSWSSADAAAIDAATGYAGVGYYTRDEGEAGWARQALARVVPSFGAWWWQDDDGTLRFSRIVAPETYAGPLAFDLARNDLEGDLVAKPDLAPNLTRRWAYRPNAQALSASDLVTDVVDLPQSRRDELTALWRGQVYAAAPLPERYRHADTAEPFVSAFWHAADAQAECDRVVAMYGSVRHFYALTYTGSPGLAPKPGQVGRLTHPRYGLAAGKQLLVHTRTFNPVTGKTTLALWG